MEQYVRTIGFLEPTYVISKFLQAKQLNNLLFYLEELHEKNRATFDHTTVLISCYTKLKRDEGSKKLNAFLKVQ